MYKRYLNLPIQTKLLTIAALIMLFVSFFTFYYFLVSATPFNRWRMFFNLRFKNAADLTEGRLKGEIELFEAGFNIHIQERST